MSGGEWARTARGRFPSPTFDIAGMILMMNSLSIVVPVRDQERTIATDVARLLEFLPEVTSDFEVLIINDGSIDETAEIIGEFAITYPQVRWLSHPLAHGSTALTQVALRHTAAGIVMFVDSIADVRFAEIRELWEMRDDRELVMVRPRIDAAHPRRSGAVRMIRRAAIDRLSQIPNPESFLHVDASHTQAGMIGNSHPRYLVRMQESDMDASLVPIL